MTVAAAGRACLFFDLKPAYTNSMKPPDVLKALWLATAVRLACTLVALPVDFVPVQFKPDDGLLYPLAYDNGTQLGGGRGPFVLHWQWCRRCRRSGADPCMAAESISIACVPAGVTLQKVLS